MPRTEPPPSLRSLFLLLQRGGFPVTPRLHIQLAHIYGLGPAGGTDQLQRILRALLVKRPEQRKAFDELFEQWRARTMGWFEQATRKPGAAEPADPATAAVRPAQSQQTRPEPTADTPPARPWRLLAVLISVLLIALLVRLTPEQKTPGAATPPTNGPTRPPDQIQAEQTDLRQKRMPFMLPRPRIERIPPWPWLALSLAALAGLPGLALIARRRDSRRRPGSRPVGTDVEPPAPLGPAAAQPALLDRTQRRAMVWGLEKFSSELPAPGLDLPATVDATAREAGILRPVFARVRLERGLWLWLDDSSQDPTAALLARETGDLLSRAGIPVDRAGFYADPQRLITQQGKRLRPADLEEQRAEITVLIFTDGRRLLALYEGPARRRLQHLLSRLSHWPRLVLVDFSSDGRLAGFARAHHLDCVTPGALAAYLGQDSGAATDSAGAGLWGDEGIWAAACALAPDGLGRDTALALARELELGLGPWSLRTLLLDAGASGARLGWPLAQRVQWLRWLSDLGAVEQTDSPLNNALAFWDQHFSLLLDGYEGPARHSPGALRLMLRRSLIRLWRAPEQASAELDTLLAYARDDGSPLLKSEISRHLSQLCPADQAGQGLIQLPWRWEALAPQTRERLKALGLGGSLPKETLAPPGRRELARGLVLGAATAALLLALLAWVRPSAPPELPEPGAEPMPHALLLDGPGKGNWQVAVVHPQGVSGQSAGAGTRVVLEAEDWASQELACIEDLVLESPEGSSSIPGAERRRCGHGMPKQRLTRPDIPRSLAVLWAVAGNPGAEKLAERLLSGGSVDQILLAPPASGQRAVDPGDLIETAEYTQVLLFGTRDTRPSAALHAVHPGPQAWIGVDDWQSAADRLVFDGVQSLKQRFGEQAHVLSGDRAGPRLGGVAENGCRTGETHETRDIVFVRLCGGEFIMGDDASDQKDEKPAHPVQVPDFWLARTETSNEQYRRYRPKHASQFQGAELPVQNVTWEDAKAFCASLGAGYRLPSEAEWEYAARAGNPGRWSFGDEEALLGEYAVYGKNTQSGPEPVGERKPNRWGLSDMHGNVWEWVEDCWHDDYTAAPADGAAWLEASGGDCSERVLRGGSYDYSAAGLRSADRVRYGAADGFRLFGFRCARSARQP